MHRAFFLLEHLSVSYYLAGGDVRQQALENLGFLPAILTSLAHAVDGFVGFAEVIFTVLGIAQIHCRLFFWMLVYLRQGWMGDRKKTKL